MTNSKMTKKDWYNEIASIVEATNVDNKEGILAFIEHEIDLLNRKSSKTGETAKQKENADIKQVIMDVLTENEKAMTITELIADDRLPYTNQRVSALLKQLVDSGKVVKNYDKKKAYFSMTAEEVETNIG